MLLLAVCVKVGRLAPPEMEKGAAVLYRFFSIGVTYPLLFAIGTVLTPWKELVAAISPASLVTIAASVATLAGTGFATARVLAMYPVEVALVNLCHSGMGGAGDVAILSAAKRLELMPFAQIATRLGGAVTVVLALLLLRHVS
jgi:Na+/citrate or Na+/malate symporter